MTSEWPHLSRRVQRSLPQSRAGQVLLTWLNPGPGTGFMYAVANLTTVVCGSLAAVFLFGQNSIPVSSAQAICQCGFTWCYVVIFLGVGALLIALLRKYFFISMTAGFLVHVILLLFACGVPQIVTLTSNYYGRGDTYSLLQSTNPIWTLMEATDNSAFYSGPEGVILMFVLPAAATIVLLLCFRLVAADLRHRRRTLPERVAEEEAELHPVAAIGPTNPWDLPSEEQ